MGIINKKELLFFIITTCSLWGIDKTFFPKKIKQNTLLTSGAYDRAINTNLFSKTKEGGLKTAFSRPVALPDMGVIKPNVSEAGEIRPNATPSKNKVNKNKRPKRNSVKQKKKKNAIEKNVSDQNKNDSSHAGGNNDNVDIFHSYSAAGSNIAESEKGFADRSYAPSPENDHSNERIKFDEKEVIFPGKKISFDMPCNSTVSFSGKEVISICRNKKLVVQVPPNIERGETEVLIEAGEKYFRKKYNMIKLAAFDGSDTEKPLIRAPAVATLTSNTVLDTDVYLLDPVTQIVLNKINVPDKIKNSKSVVALSGAYFLVPEIKNNRNVLGFYEIESGKKIKLNNPLISGPVLEIDLQIDIKTDRIFIQNLNYDDSEFFVLVTDDKTDMASFFKLVYDEQNELIGIEDFKRVCWFSVNSCRIDTIGRKASYYDMKNSILYTAIENMEEEKNLLFASYLGDGIVPEKIIETTLDFFPKTFKNSSSAIYATDNQLSKVFELRADFNTTSKIEISEFDNFNVILNEILISEIFKITNIKLKIGNLIFSAFFSNENELITQL